MNPSGYSQYFCPLPWIAVGMRNNGDLRVCAHSNNSEQKGLSLKPDQTLFNARSDSFDSFRNSPLMKDIRQTMLKGEWHPNCIRCHDEVKSGLRARIHYETELRQDIIDHEKATLWTAQDGSIDTATVPLSLLDVRFGNKCNLKCRTCNPTESDAWYGDHNKIYGPTFKYDGQVLKLNTSAEGRVTLGSDFFDWFESEKFWTDFKTSLKSISQLYCAGGEPLKTKAHLRMLNEIISSGHASHISLEYNTNWYSIPAEAWPLWDHFKEIKLGVSIDSIGAMNDYIRHPSRWSLIEKNLKMLDETSSKYIAWLTLTVHAYNIYYLPEIIEWRLLSNFKKINNSPDGSILSDHPVHNPKHLNIQMLPQAVKNKVSEKFDQFKKTLPEFIATNDFTRSHPQSLEQIVRLLDGYRDFMFAKDRSEHFPKFISYTQTLDRVRKENFSSVFPDFFSIMIAESADFGSILES